MSTPSDPGENASPYVDELEEAVFGVENPDVPAPRTAVGDVTAYALDPRPSGPRATAGSATEDANLPPRDSRRPDTPLPPVPVKTGSASDTARWQATARRNAATEDPADIEPRVRQMNSIGLTAYILESRDRTVNLVMILLASAVLMSAIVVAIQTVSSRLNPVFIVGLTSAGTVVVAVLAGKRSAKKRREADKRSRPTDGKKVSDSKTPPRLSGNGHATGTWPRRSERRVYGAGLESFFPAGR